MFIDFYVLRKNTEDLFKADDYRAGNDGLQPMALGYS